MEIISGKRHEFLSNLLINSNYLKTKKLYIFKILNSKSQPVSLLADSKNILI